MLSRILAFAIALTVVGCGGDDNLIEPPPPAGVEGSWSGTFKADSGTQDVSLSLELADSEGTVTGTGTLVSKASSFPLKAAGNFDSPRLSLLLTTPGFDPVSLVALVGAEDMVGTIGGGGFKNESLTLDRQ
jgi:hypothetical protein